MSAASQVLTKVVGQRANICSLAALDGKCEAGGVPGDYFELSDVDGTRCQGNLLTCARAFISGLSLDFYGGIARRQLHLRAKKVRKSLFNLWKRQVCNICNA